MANNRLYIYDPETKEAVFLAACLGAGWHRVGNEDSILRFMEQSADDAGFDSGKPTQLQLVTEPFLPPDCTILN